MTPANNSSDFNQSKATFRLALLFIAIVVATSSCARLKSDNRSANVGGHGNTSESNSGPRSAPPSAVASGTPTSWEAHADSLNAKEGETMTLACAPNGTPHNVWGSDIYTTDSSVCTAAVHSGLMTFEQGGTVTVELRPGRSIYGASDRNGVTTQTYGSWPHSFIFRTPNTESVVHAAEETTPILWNTAANIAGFEVGKTINFTCPPNGKESSVWGTDIYTLDSSICTAAVHAGKIKLESGGPITIEMRPGQQSYQGSERNGIKTNDFEQYESSFVLK